MSGMLKPRTLVCGIPKHLNRENPFFIWDFLGLKNLLKDFSGNPTQIKSIFVIIYKLVKCFLFEQTNGFFDEKKEP